MTPPPTATPRHPGAVTTVAIVDDQPIPRSGLEHLAAGIPGMTIATSVASIDDLDPDAIYDAVMLHLTLDDGSLSLKTIMRVAEISRPLVISTWDRQPGLLAAVQAGARGCVTQQSTHDTVTCALSTVAAGGFYLCHQLSDRFARELNRSPRIDPHGLAPREAETLQWIARGLTQAEVAHRMGLTPATINTYAKRIRGKLKVNSRAELTRIAIDLGVLVTDSRPDAAA